MALARRGIVWDNSVVADDDKVAGRCEDCVATRNSVCAVRARPDNCNC